MAGRLFERLTIDGEEWYSVAVQQDISTDLDIVGGKDQGNLLIRGPVLWVPLTAGLAGNVLTTNGPGQDPSWQPGGGAGSGYWVSNTPSLFFTTIGAATKGVTFEPAFEIQVTALGGMYDPIAGHVYQASCYNLASSVDITEIVAQSAPFTIPSGPSRVLTLTFAAPATLLPGNRYFCAMSRIDGPDNFILKALVGTPPTYFNGLPQTTTAPSPGWNPPGTIVKAVPGIGDAVNISPGQAFHNYLHIVV